MSEILDSMYVARNQYLERLKSARTNGLIKIG